MLESASQADGHAEVLEHYVAMPTRMLAEEHLGRLASQNILATAYQADGQVKKPGARRRGGHKGAWRQPPFPTYIAGEIFVIHTSGTKPKQRWYSGWLVAELVTALLR